MHARSLSYRRWWSVTTLEHETSSTIRSEISAVLWETIRLYRSQRGFLEKVPLQCMERYGR